MFQRFQFLLEESSFKPHFDVKEHFEKSFKRRPGSLHESCNIVPGCSYYSADAVNQILLFQHPGFVEYICNGNEFLK